jgi:hypothetical protein
MARHPAIAFSKIATKPNDGLSVGLDITLWPFDKMPILVFHSNPFAVDQNFIITVGQIIC